MTELLVFAAIAAHTITSVVAIRVMRSVGRTATHAALAKDATEFAMMEKVTVPRINRVRAAKSEPIHPYGL